MLSPLDLGSTCQGRGEVTDMGLVEWDEALHCGESRGETRNDGE